MSSRWPFHRHRGSGSKTLNSGGLRQYLSSETLTEGSLAFFFGGFRTLIQVSEETQPLRLVQKCTRDQQDLSEILSTEGEYNAFLLYFEAQQAEKTLHNLVAVSRIKVLKYFNASYPTSFDRCHETTKLPLKACGVSRCLTGWQAKMN